MIKAELKILDFDIFFRMMKLLVNSAWREFLL